LAINVAGGKTVLPASTTTQAPLNLPQGTAPTSPANGDFWTTSAGVFARIAGSTQSLLSGTINPGTAGYVAVYTAPNAISSSANLPNIATVTATAQTSSIGTTTLYAVPSSGAGMYAVYVDVICTTAGTGGTIVVNVSWNNGTTSAGFNTQSFSLTAQGEQGALLGNFISEASHNITYSTTVSGSSGSPAYTLNIRLQYLG
jgi:hypothetical protein